MDGPDIGGLIGRARDDDALTPDIPERRRRSVGPRRDVGVPPMAPPDAAPLIERQQATPQLDNLAASIELDDLDVSPLDVPAPEPIRAPLTTPPAMAPPAPGPDGATFWAPRIPVGTVTLHGVEIPVEADGRPILEPLDGRDLGAGSLSRLLDHFE